MRRTGQVNALEGDRAEVKVETTAECGACAAKHYCHGAGPQIRSMTAINRAGAAVGDTVVIEAAESRVIVSAVLVWIVPIVAMIAGYLLFASWGTGAATIAAFAALALSFVLLRVVDRLAAGGGSFYPVITAVLDGPPPSSGESCHT